MTKRIIAPDRCLRWLSTCQIDSVSSQPVARPYPSEILGVAIDAELTVFATYINCNRFDGQNSSNRPKVVWGILGVVRSPHTARFDRSDSCM